MNRYALIPALALAVGAISLSAMPVASASFGTGIGVSFPTSGSHSSEIVPSYAAFSFDNIVEEPLGGAHRDVEKMAKRLKDRIQQDLNALRPLETEQLLEQRYQRLLGYGYC